MVDDVSERTLGARVTAAPPVLVLVVGPAAAGKSAISRALADRLRGDGCVVALVELDAIAAMALPTLPDWSLASGIFAEVTGRWLEAPLDVVIAEGVSSRDEVERVLAAVPSGVPIIVAAATVSFETAVLRALSDPSRGVTRDPSYLRGVYDRWEAEAPRLGADLTIDTTPTIDTDTTSLDAGVEILRNAIRRAQPTRRR